tara:strand:- start:393 stop:1058 length:666 start_codon:yes stop_codon:yes gene_type:complete
MAITISGTNGIVGAGFTVDNSGVSVTAGVGTFGTLAAPAAGLTGALPALSAASLTSIPAANIVGLATAGFERSGGFGKVLQAVSATTTSVVSNTTTTFADTGLSASITISANSKVLVLCIQHLDVQRGTSSTPCTCAVKLLRGSTDIFAPGNSKNVGIEGSTDLQKILFLPLNFSFLDTGASTGSNTYKLQGKVATASDGARVRFQDDSNPSTITLLEIAG